MRFIGQDRETQMPRYKLRFLSDAHERNNFINRVQILFLLHILFFACRSHADIGEKKRKKKEKKTFETCRNFKASQR